MNLQDLKIGDKIFHFCFGELVEAEVVAVQKTFVQTKHEPIQWGRDTYINSYVSANTHLQITTPKAFYNGEIITSSK